MILQMSISLFNFDNDLISHSRKLTKIFNSQMRQNSSAPAQGLHVKPILMQNGSRMS